MDTIDTSNPLKPWIVKDPDARLDYTWDWTEWLEDSADSIASAQVTSTGTVDAEAPVINEGNVTCFLSGGKEGTTQSATCRITTAAGRVDDRTLYLKLKSR